jgi:hypothetical protein
VALFVAETLTPGSKAWLASSTVPLTVAYVDCANAGPDTITEAVMLQELRFFPFLPLLTETQSNSN